MENQLGGQHQSRLRYSVSSESIRDGTWDRPAVGNELDRRSVVSDMVSQRNEPLYGPLASFETANEELRQNSMPVTSREISNTADASEDHQEGAYKSIPTAEATAVGLQKSSKKTPFSKAAEFANDWWLWELIGILLSAGSMIAVVILCARLNNTSLSDWNIQIGPNTLIAILVTIAKAAMLLPVTECISQLKWLHFSGKSRALRDIDWIEGASRGPWGSFLFFCRNRFRTMTISWGALLMIFALAMSPFAQQVISFESRNVAQAGKAATIPVSRIYDSGLVLSGLAASVNPAQYTSREMQGAFFNGLFNLSTKLDFSCSTGNCTWPAFSSLGVCSTCDRVQPTTTNINTTYCNGTYGDFWKICDVNATYTTPRNLTLESFVYWQVNSAVATYDDHSLLSSFSEDTWVDNQDDLAVVGFARMPALPDPEPNNVRNASIDWLNSAELTECSLSFCAKTYQDITVVNGSLVENYTVTDTPLDWSSQYWDGNRWFLRSSVNLSNRAFEPFDNATVILGYYDFLSVAGFLSNMLNFTLRDVSADAYFDGSFTFSAGQAFNYSNSVSDTMSTIATSLTNIVRQSRNATVADGVGFEAQTFIVVNWPWLSLPLALVLLTAAFLATVVCMSHCEEAPPIWKSSLVPLLFRGLEGWERHDLRGEKRTELERLAATMQTQLMRNHSGDTQFSRVD
ncbi:hypothetical protein HDK77DRAFT_72165 [Phyllosticta capitalensis]|uniref:uncharacterized protein n=1 Tax=Phyllosticta capitalensis TaxID=121624 RepID=UPI00312FDB50